MLSVRNMVSLSSGREVANQFVINNNDVVMFQSYSSPIISIDRANKKISVYQDYNYSRTTGKYRNQFLESQGFSELANIKSLEKCLSVGKIDDYSIALV